MKLLMQKGKTKNSKSVNRFTHHVVDICVFSTFIEQVYPMMHFFV